MASSNEEQTCNLVVTPSSNSSMQIFEGRLEIKLVKGWQWRWFMLSNETGNLAYYQEGVIGKEQHVAGAVVIPCALKKTPMGVWYGGLLCSSVKTFHVNFASGESYKLRAANVWDRQVWVYSHPSRCT